MGFDDLRPPRAREHDTWGFIGTKHRAPEKVAPLVCEAASVPSEGGSPCVRDGCTGSYVLAHAHGDGIRCWIEPPCDRCTGSFLACRVCQHQPDEEPA